MKKYILSCIDELKNKIEWPSYSQAQSNVKLVFIGAFIFAVVIGVLDLLLKSFFSWVYNIL